MKANLLFKSLLLPVTIIVIGINAYAQKSAVLLTVGNEKITQQEFETIYKKNNLKPATTTSKDSSVREYLDLFINFRLKVKEAESRGLDTGKDFKTELAGYRKQLAQPYLTDKEVTDKLINEAFQRSQKEVKASHILIKCAPDALPKDTLEAYNKIVGIRDRIVKKGEDFGTLAKLYSDDPSGKQNLGDLGYFSVFTMVYPFESAAYNTTPGIVSQPVRTRFGYHIIKTMDIRPAQGEIKVEHIMLRTPKNMTTADSIKIKTKIDSIYSLVKSGGSFEETAKQFSEDKNSARNGGLLQPFSTGRMVQEFEEAAFALKANGEISKPIKTQYGWHIIKRIDKKALPGFDEVKNDIKNKIQKDSRSELNKQSFINKLKKEYNFTETLKSRDAFYTVGDTNLKKGTWKAELADKLNQPLCSFANTKLSQTDFAKYIETHQFTVNKQPMITAINNLYDAFVAKSLTDYEESRLEEKYPEFKSLMQEYRDGILLFQLTDEMVWSRAVKDTVGLQDFFNKNNNNYKWGERLDATVYSCKNEKIAGEVRKLLKDKKVSQDSLINKINKENPLNLTVKTGKFERGENSVVDGIEWKAGMTKNITSGTTVSFVNVKGIIPSQLKTLNEVRGAATADYQNYLEKEWIKTLKEKYPVTVDKTVLNALVQ